MTGDRELFLAGTGSFAHEVAEWARDAGWSLAGLLELGATEPAAAVAGLPVLRPAAVPERSRVAIAAGGDRAAHHATLSVVALRGGTVVHPRAHVAPSARLGDGCIVAPGAVIGAEAVIGEHTLVSRGALLGHHARLGRFVSLLPGTNVGGNAEVGDRTRVGMGAVIVDHTSVGADVTVAAGAVVLDAVADGRRVQGVPAREYER